MNPDARCPCLSGDTYSACCGRFVDGGQAAPTAVQLMRSRYTAFAVGATDHLLTTWHPATRPADLDLDPAQQWRRLDIVGHARGGLLDQEGTVEFRAHYRFGGRPGVLHERSRFVRDEGRWVYLDGVHLED
ncbi:hypothetical protein G4X40_05790 [Rhodococcus sp. D2-41]|uniref:YchJ family protein n=1 Tax=Speluncibacter jeojiensis TaxID=2710754 RepID=UPI0024103B9C|nr:YchJ family metal-binding protein [Rhodococcus sp. D2-41]MDG3009655.1 hypothetical protein [Rhodococcus sp. D2-41]